MPDSVAVHKTKPTNKIVFISFYSNVYTNQFASELGAGLLDTKRFTIARETRDKRRVEETGLNNFFNVRKITKLDEGIIFLGDKVQFYCRFCSRCFECCFNFLGSETPLTITNLVLIKALTDSGVGDSELISSFQNCLTTKLITKVVGDVLGESSGIDVSGARHWSLALMNLL